MGQTSPKLQQSQHLAIIECLDNASRAENAAAQNVKDRILDKLKLKGEPQTVKQLAALTDAAVSYVRVQVRELLNDGLVVCSNVERGANDSATYWIA